MKRIAQRDLQNLYAPLSAEAQDALRRTLRSLPEKKEKILMKKKLSAGVIAAIVIMLGMISVALAGGLLSERLINWKGEVMEEETELVPALTPRPELVPGFEKEEELSKRVMQLSRNVDPHEIRIGYWMDESGNKVGQASSRRTQRFESYEALAQALQAVPYLTMPDTIPEEYHFEEGEIFLMCAADADFTLSETIRDESGVMVDCYRIAPEDDVIVGYSALYRASEADYHYLRFRADLTAALDENEFMIGLREMEEARTISLPGTENALLISAQDRMELMTRKKIAEAVRVHDLMELFHPEDGRQITDYTEEIFEIFAPRLSAEEILQMYPEQ